MGAAELSDEDSLADSPSIALLLAATGIFAIVAHVIGTRRREIGVRMALGATHAQVLTTVGESGARPAAIGLVAGIVAAIVARARARVGRLRRALVRRRVLGARGARARVVIVASAYLAARRALRVDPAESLRFE